MISCQSLSKLFAMVRDKYNLSYILTHRLNQDGLEHFFAVLRQMGATHDHPNPVSVKYRIRSHLLGRQSALVGYNYISDKENRDVEMSEGAFSALNTKQSTVNDTIENSLQQELCVSAMMFSAINTEDPVTSSEEDMFDPVEADKLNIDLEQVVENEGLDYVGG